jgi:hypothetical protein
MTPLLLPIVTPKAVAPTPTLLATIHVEEYALLCMQFENLDATQTLDVTIKVRSSRTGNYAPNSFSELLGIAALTPAAVPIDVKGFVDIQFWGVASGAGLNCTISGLLVRGT